MTDRNSEEQGNAPNVFDSLDFVDFLDRQDPKCFLPSMDMDIASVLLSQNSFMPSYANFTFKSL